MSLVSWVPLVSLVSWEPLVSWVPLVPLVSGVWRPLLLMSGMSVVHSLSVSVAGVSSDSNICGILVSAVIPTVLSSGGIPTPPSGRLTTLVHTQAHHRRVAPTKVCR